MTVIIVIAALLVAAVPAALALHQVMSRGQVPEDEGVLRCAPEWAVEAFGQEAAFEIGELGTKVVDDLRAEMVRGLDEQSWFLYQVPVSAVLVTGVGDDTTVVVQFADGSEMRVGRIDERCDDSVDSLADVAPRACARGVVRLDSISVVGPEVRIGVRAGSQLWVLRSRALELDVPRRTGAEWRRVLRRLSKGGPGQP